jgi:zinc protease
MTPTLHQRLLACGMPLLVVESHEAPVATIDLWIRAGAADDPTGAAGMAHFMEHMLFKGTRRRGLGEIERAIEAVGGACNAGTAHDFTHYYVTLPSGGVELAIDALADMAAEAMLDSGELEKERLVILEEYRRKQDDPAGVLDERLDEELYAGGPYRRPVLGDEASIRAIDRRAMQAFYRGRYHAGTMALVAAGDVDADAIAEVAERLTANLRPAAPAAAARPGSRFSAGHRLRLAKLTGGELYVAFAWPAPGWNRPDRVLALDLAQSILGHGRGARLYQELKERRALCSSLSVAYPTQAGDSMFAVIATCRPDGLEALRAALLEELERFVVAPVAAEDDRRARRLMAGAHRFSLETSGSLAMQAGYAWAVAGDLGYFEQYLERLEATGPEDARAALAEVLPPGGAMAERMVEVAVGPEQAAGAASDASASPSKEASA